jgi:hypothetical protein
MLRSFVCLIVFLSWAASAYASPDLCHAAAQEIETSLRAFAPVAIKSRAYITIPNAAAFRPAAGLGFGSKAGDASLQAFPLTEVQRKSFDGSIRLIYRAGGPKGLVMLDAVQGTAYCHNPIVFSMASGSPEPLAVPLPDDPFDRCQDGGVALGAAGDKPFYAQTDDFQLERESLTVFTLSGKDLVKSCKITADYAIVYETAESFCKEPALCTDDRDKIAAWAGEYRAAGGRVNSAALSPAAEGQVPQNVDGEFPLFGAEESKIVPQPFRFDGSEAWLIMENGPRADLLRIGPAAIGPVMMADWKSYTLATLYKGAEPVASFAVGKRRAGLLAVQVQDAKD